MSTCQQYHASAPRNGYRIHISHDIVMLARQGYTIGDIAVAFSISLDEVNRRIREHLLYMRISKTPTSAD